MEEKDQQDLGRNQDLTKDEQQPPTSHDRNAQPIGGNDSGGGTGTTMSSGSSTGEAGPMDTGQAAYGNSGQGRESQSRNAASQDGSAEQDFAAQGQGAIDSESLEGRSPTEASKGTDDSEVERGQGREESLNRSM